MKETEHTLTNPECMKKREKRRSKFEWYNNGHIVRICCLSVAYDSHWCGLYEKNKQLRRLFLGGRGLNAWVAALSAQASDMSGWLLMGLPGAIYSLGTGQIWIAVGLFIGTVLNWVCISHRLRKYTIAANNSLTIPAFFCRTDFRIRRESCYCLSIHRDRNLFLVYTASALAAGRLNFLTTVIWNCIII